MGIKRGQVSLEYTFIVGFALMMLIPILIMYNTHRETVKNDVNLVQISSIATKITDNADKVHFMGEPSKTTIEVRMPEGVQDVVINGRSINFRVDINDNLVDVRSYSDINLTGYVSPDPGRKSITIAAIEDAVNITG